MYQYYFNWKVYLQNLKWASTIFLRLSWGFFFISSILFSTLDFLKLYNFIKSFIFSPAAFSLLITVKPSVFYDSSSTVIFIFFHQSGRCNFKLFKWVSYFFPVNVNAQSTESSQSWCSQRCSTVRWQKGAPETSTVGETVRRLGPEQAVMEDIQESTASVRMCGSRLCEWRAGWRRRGGGGGGGKGGGGEGEGGGGKEEQHSCSTSEALETC